MSLYTNRNSYRFRKQIYGYQGGKGWGGGQIGRWD